MSAAIPQAILNQAEAIYCRRSLARFVNVFWPVIISEELVWEPHMGALCAEIEEVFKRVFLQPDPADPGHKIRLAKDHDLVINIPPGTTKPVWEEMEVLMAGGHYKPLKEISVGEYVIGKSGRPCRVAAVHLQGLQPCVKISTFASREIIAALDHPILTTQGWINAGEIETEDRLALMHKPRIASASPRSLDEFKLAGYFIGDGSVSSGNCSITSNDTPYIEELKEVIDRLGFKCFVRKSKNGVSVIKVSKGDKRIGPREWLRDIGMAGLTSKTKKIPGFVWGGTEEQVAAFLACYFQCDGTVSFKHEGKRSLVVSCSTISEELARGLQRLFLRLGLSMRIRTRVAKSGFVYNRGLINYKYFTIETTEQDVAARFMARIPLIGPKRAKLESFKPVKRTFEQDYYPDRVAAVTPVGLLPCRCLSVDDDQSFIVEGVVVHNSTISTIMAPAWAWTNDPSLRIITGSYSDALATEHSQKSRDVITSDPYRILFPSVRIKDDKGLKTNYETTANGQRFATSVRGTVTGVHAHVIIIDDPVNPQQAASQQELKTANAWMDKTLSTRKIDKKVTVQILIMQRLAVNDPTGHALAKKKEKVTHINLPGEYTKRASEKYKWIYDDNGGILSPRRLSRAELKELREDLGSSGYAGQIQQEPAPEGGLTWKEEWFIKVPDRLFPSVEDANEMQNDWDLAYTKEDINAASAFITSGVMGGKIYIFDFGWAWHEFPELIKWMKSLYYPHFIEAKASGKSAKQTLRKEGIVAVEVKVNKDKIARAKDASPAAESGLVYIRESMADRFFNDPKQGILYFPSGEYQDLADCLSQMLVRRTKKGKIASSSGTTARGPVAPGDIPVPQNPLDWIK